LNPLTQNEDYLIRRSETFDKISIICMVCHPKLIHAVAQQSEMGDIMTASLHIFSTVKPVMFAQPTKMETSGKLLQFVRCEGVGEEI
jgi:hypothetical protein